jgi:hypothetical protein
MTETALDRVHAAMEAAPEDDAARLAFFDRLAGAELFLLLSREAEGAEVTPETFPIDGVPYVAAFDTEERLASFAGRIVPYAALSGRALAPLLSAQGLGLVLNPEAAPSAMVLSPEVMDWLAQTLAPGPRRVEERAVAVGPPGDLPGGVLAAIDAKLASAAGLARHAWLVSATYTGGRRGDLLAIVDAAPGAQTALARAIGEALTFSGVEAGVLDVAFFAATDPVMARIAKVGLRFDLPAQEAPAAPAAPGMDPDRPPRLR